jgi:hypothetical protein
MPFVTSLGIGAAAIFGIGVGARAFFPIIAPAIGKVGAAGWRATKFAARRGLWPAAKGGTPMVTRAMGSAADLALRAGQFAIRHPYMTLGAIGAGAYLATDTSPYESPSLSGVRMNSRFNEEQLAAEALNESGVASMGGIVSGAAIRNQRLMESTYGLTQGLHRSRH